MQRALLAIDVGGSTSRAALVDETGHCLGYGKSSGGNPASNNPDEAASAIVSAVGAAVADSGGGPLNIIVALIALAGPQVRVAQPRLEEAFRAAGLTGPVVFHGDLLAMFASVANAENGYGVVSGTGAGAVRIRSLEIDRVIDAAGWLLGDLGSGYWLGHQAARAAVADLEGRGEPTGLTTLILELMKIKRSDEWFQGRPAHLRALIDGVYAMRPIELAKFARIVLARPNDPVAARLLDEGERHLVDHLALIFEPARPGPVVIGGSIAWRLPGLKNKLAEFIRGAARTEPDIRMAAEGTIGAVVLAMRALQLPMYGDTFDRIELSISARMKA